MPDSDPLQNTGFKKFIKCHRDNKNFLSFAIIGSVIRPEMKIFNDVDCVILTGKNISNSQIVSRLLYQFKSDCFGQFEDVLVYNISNLRISCFYISQANLLR